MALHQSTKKAATVLALAMMLLPSRQATEEAAGTVAAALPLLALAVMLVPHAEKPDAPPVHRWRLPLRPCSDAVRSPPSRAAARTCCRVPSPAGNLCLLAFPSCGPPLPPAPAAAVGGGKRNSASRSGGAGQEPLLRHGTRTDQAMPNHDGKLQAAAVDKNLTPLDEFIKFTNAHHTNLIAAIDAMKAEHKTDMEKIKSETHKIISELTRHAGELKNLNKEVARQGTTQRLVIGTVLIATMALGFLVWKFHEEWMNRAGKLVKVWAGDAMYELNEEWMNRAGKLVKVWAGDAMYELTGGCLGKKR